jgi:hypothetical protein
VQPFGFDGTVFYEQQLWCLVLPSCCLATQTDTTTTNNTCAVVSRRISMVVRGAVMMIMMMMMDDVMIKVGGGCLLALVQRAHTSDLIMYHSQCSSSYARQRICWGVCCLLLLAEYCLFVCLHQSHQRKHSRSNSQTSNTNNTQTNTTRIYRNDNNTRV